MKGVRFIRGKVAKRVAADSLDIVYLRSVWPLDWTSRADDALVLAYEDARAVAEQFRALALGIPVSPAGLSEPRVAPEFSFAENERRGLA